MSLTGFENNGSFCLLIIQIILINIIWRVITHSVNAIWIVCKNLTFSVFSISISHKSKPADVLFLFTLHYYTVIGECVSARNVIGAILKGEKKKIFNNTERKMILKTP